LQLEAQGAGKLPSTNTPFRYTFAVRAIGGVSSEHSTGFQSRLSQHRFDLQISVCARGAAEFVRRASHSISAARAYISTRI
jgi:hypothetical protein